LEGGLVSSSRKKSTSSSRNGGDVRETAEGVTCMDRLLGKQMTAAATSVNNNDSAVLGMKMNAIFDDGDGAVPPQIKASSSFDGMMMKKQRQSSSFNSSSDQEQVESSLDQDVVIGTAGGPDAGLDVDTVQKAIQLLKMMDEYLASEEIASSS
jgi:hypothetical protein